MNICKTREYLGISVSLTRMGYSDLVALFEDILTKTTTKVYWLIEVHYETTGLMS